MADNSLSAAGPWSASSNFLAKRAILAVVFSLGWSCLAQLVKRAVESVARWEKWMAVQAASTKTNSAVSSFPGGLTTTCA